MQMGNLHFELDSDGFVLRIGFLHLGGHEHRFAKFPKWFKLTFQRFGDCMMSEIETAVSVLGQENSPSLRLKGVSDPGISLQPS